MMDLFIEAIADAVLRKLAPLFAAARVQARLLTVEQAGVGVHWADRKGGARPAGSRYFPQIKADSRVMIDVRDLDLWIERNKS